jgi:hypothetical protein
MAVARGVLIRAYEASGGAAWATVRSIHTRAAIETGGLRGHAESWDDVARGRYLDTFTLGPASGAEGFDGRVGWWQDSAGHALPRDRESDRRAAINEAFRRSRAYWFPARRPARIDPPTVREDGGRRFHVVPISPLDGAPFELWIDADTLLIDRTVERIAGETRTVRLSEYRAVAGVYLPFRQLIATGDPRHGVVVAVETVDVNEPEPVADFALPRRPAADFGIAGGRPSTGVPFELVGNHVHLEARLNGRGPFTMLCDTGGRNVMSAPVATRLGLRVEGIVPGRGVGEATEHMALTTLDTLQIGDATLTRQLFGVMSLEAMGRVEGVALAGIVGHELFQRFVVTIDYERRRLGLTVPSRFTYAGAGTSVPMTFNGVMPQVEGRIDGVHGRIDLDTGSRAALTLMRPFVDRHRLAERYRASEEALTGWGIGGPSRARLIRVGELRLGAVRVAHVIGELPARATGTFNDPHAAATVGGGVLKRFTVTFDYDHRRVIFDEHAHTGTPDAGDRSGLWLNLDDEAFEVADVVADSPAARAGIARGDRILAMGDRRRPELTLAGARQALRGEPGARVRLTIGSRGGIREAVIVLRDLV